MALSYLYKERGECMSSYFPSFNYLGINSRERGLVVSHFDADQGESDTFLGMEPIYTESADGTRRLDYGAKYNNVATFRITAIKPDSSDFSVTEIRDHLRWLTGVKKNSQLDLLEHFSEEFISDGKTTVFPLANESDHVFNVYVNNVTTNDFNMIGNTVELTSAQSKGAIIRIAYCRIKYSFIGRITNVWQYKMDSRTIGLILEYTSISPWAYSSRHSVSAAVSGSKTITINNETDDLYGYTPVNTRFANSTGTSLTITNQVTKEVTKVTNIGTNEVVTISDNMMITSSNTSKTFGNSFNFVFPRLVAGSNKMVVNGTGTITFEYVHCIKIGDCAMDINVISDPIYDDDGNIQLDTLPWSRITDTPTTFQGYGITNVYSKVETDSLISPIKTQLSNTYTKAEVNNMYLNLKTDLSKIYTKSEVDKLLSDITARLAKIYTKSEVDALFDDVYSKAEVNHMYLSLKSDLNNIQIDENELESMLASELN